MKSRIYFFAFFLFFHPASQVYAGNCVKIGLIEEFQRSQAKTAFIFGSELEAGVNIALRRINDNKPENCIELVKIDVGNTLANIDDVIQSSVSKGVLLFIGLGISDKVSVALPALKKTKSLLISPTATSDELVGSDRRSILMAPRNSLISSEIARNLKLENVKKVSIIYAKNSTYSVNMADEFVRVFSDVGGEVDLTIGIYPGETNLSRHMDKIKRSSSYMFMPLFEMDVVNIVSFLSKNNIQKKYIGTDSWGTYSDVIKKLSHETGFNALVPVIYSPNFKSELNRYFVSQYKTMYSRKPTDAAAFSFEALLLCEKMLSVCGEKRIIDNPFDCLRDALPFQGLDGDVTTSYYLSLNRRLHMKKLSK